PVERVLALARRTDLPIRGVLSASGHFEGTKENPQGTFDLDLTRAVVYQEPVDRLQARVSYLPDHVEVSELRAESGPSRITLNGRYDHPAGNIQTGNMQFQISDGRIDLQRIHNVQVARPGLKGTVELAGNGTAQIREAQPRVQLQTFSANLKADS